MKKIYKVIIGFIVCIVSCLSILYLLFVSNAFDSFDVAYEMDFDGHHIEVGSTKMFIEMHMDGENRNVVRSNDGKEILFTFNSDTPLLTEEGEVTPIANVEFKGWESTHSIYKLDTSKSYFIDELFYTLYVDEDVYQIGQLDSTELTNLISSFREREEPKDVNKFFDGNTMEYGVICPIYDLDMQTGNLEETSYSIAINNYDEKIILYYQRSIGEEIQITWYEITDEQKTNIISLFTTYKQLSTYN
ncbi:hypothetical protein [Anaerorhabdus sp.]|uniref:hypothetical protein n=1 Tax=Anaerorhabdus sp. TaxID=1872524 RepID=UPI002FC86254